MGRREDSTPTGTPGVNGNGSERRSPMSEAGGLALKSPKGRIRATDAPEDAIIGSRGPYKTFLNSASWHSTGVINDIGGYREESGDSPRKVEGRRSVSRQMLAKSTFDQKQKLMEALDNARAAELALREVVGSIKAAV